MMQSFGSTNKIPTSACSESAFNTLKHVVFPNETKLRVDVFVRRYIDYLNGRSLISIVKKNTDDKVVGCMSTSNQSESGTIKRNADSLSVKKSAKSIDVQPLTDISDDIDASEYLTYLTQILWRRYIIHVVSVYLQSK